MENYDYILKILFLFILNIYNYLIIYIYNVNKYKNNRVKLLGNIFDNIMKYQLFFI